MSSEPAGEPTGEPAPGPVQVLAPVPGRAVRLAEVPDQVFAGELVGPGAAVDPPHRRLDAVAPVTGRLVKVHPHAFVVLTGDGVGVLVHLGIDTVRLKGAGFTVYRAEGDQVSAGDPVIGWDPGAVAGAGLAPICPVIALEAGAVELSERVLAGATVAAGEPLFGRPR